MASSWTGDPLGYGSHWLGYNNPSDGGKQIHDSVTLGEQNDLSRSNSTAEGVTIVSIQLGSNNAVFAALNAGGVPPNDVSPGGVGVFGQSLAGGVDENTLPPTAPPLTAGIGVAGHCNTGCGVYGQSYYGVGAAGFASTISAPTEQSGWGAVFNNLISDNTLEAADTFPPNPPDSRALLNIGVLGQSDFGIGVRGHGGPFVPRAAPPPSSDPTIPPPAAPQYSPGGVFSSGSLNKDGDLLRVVSVSSRPQLRLVPFRAQRPGSGVAGADPDNFPGTGTLGDFFMVFSGIQVGLPSAALYVCLQVIPASDGTRVPLWSRVVTMEELLPSAFKMALPGPPAAPPGGPFPAGTPIPPI